MNEFIGPFRLLREIGRGHNAIVYEAHDTRRDEPVALKVLYTDEVEPEEGKLSLRGEATILRFVREADAIRRLQHPNIVRIRDAGADGVRLYIAMERLRGETLRSRLMRGPLPVDEAINMALQMAAALTLAHGQGIVHRDLKPDNIFLLPDGTAKLMDFGAARVTGEQSLTQTGNIIGSPAYMAPEQVSGGDADARTDVWGLGATLFEALTGQKPFTGDSVTSVMYSILHKRPDFSLIPSPPLAHVLERALAKKATTRYPSMTAFADCLRNPPRDEEEAGQCRTPMLLRPAALAGISAAALAGLLLAFFLNPSRHQQRTVEQRRTVSPAPPKTAAAPKSSVKQPRTAAAPAAAAAPPKAQSRRAPVAAAVTPRPRVIEQPQVSVQEKITPRRNPQQPQTAVIITPPPVTDAAPDPFARRQASSPARRPPVQVASAQRTPIDVSPAPRPSVQANRSRLARTQQRRTQQPRLRDGDAEVMHQVAPQVPEGEELRGYEVHLIVYINADGLVKNVKFKKRSGSELADEVAREAVSQWEYKPAARGGRFVEAEVEEVIIFD